MTEKYRVNYSEEAVADLLEIYHYIAEELLVPAVAKLDILPSRHSLVSWEPWHSMEMHKMPVDNFMVFYMVDDVKMVVTVVRIFYGGRNIEGIINNEIS